MNASIEPKPGRGLLICSTLILAACAGLLSVALGAFCITWDPCAWFSGAILLVPSVLLGIQQYLAIYRRNANAAHAASVLLWIVGGFALFAFAMTAGGMLLEGYGARAIPLLLPMLGLGVVGCWGAWMNRQWRRQLREHGVTAKAALQFTVRELLLGVAVLGAVSALTTALVRSTPPRYAEHVSRDKVPFGLPDGARDVSFCQGFRGTIAYEFTIDEKEFIAWVNEELRSHSSERGSILLTPITAPHKIRRYFEFDPKELSGPADYAITNGLSYDWSKEDMGVHAAFDRTTNRAYYFRHSH